MIHVMSYGEGIQRRTRETVLGSDGHTWISYPAECWAILTGQADS